MMRTPASEFAAQVLRHPAGWIASGAGAGFAPYASGTVGTLVALLPWLALRELPPGFYALAVVAAFALGVWASNWVIRTIQVEDPSVVVWDEFVGVWIALFAAPAGWAWLLAGFALFRLFDILKPWPVRWADDHVDGGFGAMLDDALAGLYALLCLQAAAWFLVPGTLAARLGIP
jgi:phosphatidylglycerophosphatase A